MRFKPPRKWDQESPRLFIHEDGIRIERRSYRGQEGWFLLPTDLDQEVVYFEPTPKGRDQAFAAFAAGVLVKPPKKKKKPAAAAAPRRGRKPKEEPEEDSEDKVEAETLDFSGGREEGDY